MYRTTIRQFALPAQATQILPAASSRLYVAYNSPNGGSCPIIFGNPSAGGFPQRQVAVSDTMEFYRCDYYALLDEEIWAGSTAGATSCTIFTIESDDPTCVDLAKQFARDEVYTITRIFTLSGIQRWNTLAGANEKRENLIINTQSFGDLLPYNYDPTPGAFPVFMRYSNRDTVVFSRRMHGEMVSWAHLAFSFVGALKVRVSEVIRF